MGFRVLSVALRVVSLLTDDELTVSDTERKREVTELLRIKNWAGEQRDEWRGRYNVTLCSYCLKAGEQREEWRGRYNVTLCS